MTSADFIKSSLRLFLSVDVVGSTALKQRIAKTEKTGDSTATPAEPWFSPIVQFYREIEQRFFQEWQQYQQKIHPVTHWPTGPSPKFWKGAGDELIYTKRLNDHREALVCLQAWMRVVNGYRPTFKKNNPTLDLKSTAWIAGFPVHNAEVFFRLRASEDGINSEDGDPIYSNLVLLEKYQANETDRSIVRDFIGPSIDTGFRLSTLASSRKLVVSVDLALILAHSIPKQQNTFAKDHDYKKPQLHYDGNEPLKGVFGGAPYPVFWVDMATDDDLSKVEDELTGRKPLDYAKVCSFCETFITSNPSFIIMPYIVGESEPIFQSVPERHKDRLDRLKTYWTQETAKRATEVAAALEEGAATDEKLMDVRKIARELMSAVMKDALPSSVGASGAKIKIKTAPRSRKKTPGKKAP